MNIFFYLISVPILYYYFGDFYKNIFTIDDIKEDNKKDNKEDNKEEDVVDEKKFIKKRSYEKIPFENDEINKMKRRISMNNMDNKDYGHYLYLDNEKIMKGDDFYF
jgi:hypothetical protein